MDVLFTNVGATDYERNNIQEQLKMFGQQYKVSFGQISFDQQPDTKNSIVKVSRITRGPMGSQEYYNPLSVAVALAYRNEANLVLDSFGTETTLKSLQIQKAVSEARAVNPKDPYTASAKKVFKNLKY